jgi:hypothetical protein
MQEERDDAVEAMEVLKLDVLVQLKEAEGACA